MEIKVFNILLIAIASLSMSNLYSTNYFKNAFKPEYRCPIQEAKENTENKNLKEKENNIAKPETTTEDAETAETKK